MSLAKLEKKSLHGNITTTIYRGYKNNKDIPLFYLNKQHGFKKFILEDKYDHPRPKQAPCNLDIDEFDLSQACYYLINHDQPVAKNKSKPTTDITSSCRLIDAKQGTILTKYFSFLLSSTWQDCLQQENVFELSRLFINHRYKENVHIMSLNIKQEMCFLLHEIGQLKTQLNIERLIGFASTNIINHYKNCGMTINPLGDVMDYKPAGRTPWLNLVAFECILDQKDQVALLKNYTHYKERLAKVHA